MTSGLRARVWNWGDADGCTTAGAVAFLRGAATWIPARQGWPTTTPGRGRPSPGCTPVDRSPAMDEPPLFPSPTPKPRRLMLSCNNSDRAWDNIYTWTLSAWAGPVP